MNRIEITGESYAIDDLIFGTVVTAPVAPSSVFVTDLANGSAVVDWSDNSDNEVRFDILRESSHKRRVGVWVDSTVVGSVGADVITYTDASGDGNFRYCVRSANSVGLSDWACSLVTEITGGNGGGSSFCDSHPNHKKCQ